MTIKGVFRNTSRAITIDGTYRNMSFYRKFTQNASMYQYIPKTANGNYGSLFAVHCPNGGAWVPSRPGGTNYTPDDYWALTQPMEVFEFTDNPIVRDPFGLNIRNELGVLVFSTNIKPMRVVKALSGSISDMSTNQVLIDEVVRSGRKLAVVLGLQPIKCYFASGAYIVKALEIITDTSGYVKITYKDVYSMSKPGYSGSLAQVAQYNILILDVTNY